MYHYSRVIVTRQPAHPALISWHDMVRLNIIHDSFPVTALHTTSSVDHLVHLSLRLILMYSGIPLPLLQCLVEKFTFTYYLMLFLSEYPLRGRYPFVSQHLPKPPLTICWIMASSSAVRSLRICALLDSSCPKVMARVFVL